MVTKKNFIRSIIGFSIAAIVINEGWGIFTGLFGVKGGWVSALLLTGSMWYINHHKGLVYNSQEAAFVDMGLAIGLSLIVRDMLSDGINGLEASFPTLFCVCIGGILGGIAGGFFEKRKRGSN